MRAALHALLALVVAVPARASDVTALLPDVQVEVRARSAWPAKLNKGWGPLRLELHNRGDQPARLRLGATAADWQNERTFRQSFELAPGERVDTELVLPAGGQWEQEWSVRLRSQRSDDWTEHNLLGCGGEADYRAVLAVSDRPVVQSTVAQWSERLSRRAVTSYTSAGRPAVSDDMQVGHARYEDLARSWAAYTSLDLVLIDARSELPPEARLEAIAAWVRSGGVLLVAGARGHALALERGSLAPWLEERFRAPHVARDAQSCGLGLLVFHPTDEWIDDADLRDAAYELATAEQHMAPRLDGTSRASEAPILLPGIGEIPHRVFLLLLILFGVLIGPVNFLWIARKGRPVLLLVTIPAIALVTTLALLAYGIWFQGLDVKVASQSMTFLDERLHRSSCVERRRVYAGMSPGAGLRPEAGTALHFLTSTGGGGGVPRVRSRLRIEKDPTLVLAGDYLPTRVPVEHILQSERAARGRLEASRVDGVLSVRNGLGARIESLVARDERGRWYSSEGLIEAGASAMLAPMDAPPDHTLASEPADILWQSDQRSRGELIPAATYLARLEHSPFRDDCGIETNEVSGHHRVLGVWDLQSEEWK